MSSPVVTAAVNFLPAAVGDSVTLGPDTTAGVKQVVANMLNAPGGAVITVSTQKIQTSGGSYTETASSRTLSNSVTPPAAPAAGYSPLEPTDPEMSPFGYQAVITWVSGTLPTSAVTFTIESV